MKRHVMIRVMFSFLIALVLPFPGPHVDNYVPLARVLWPDVSAGADTGFYAIVAGAGVIYAAVIFGILSLAAAWRRRRQLGRRQL